MEKVFPQQLKLFKNQWVLVLSGKAGCGKDHLAKYFSLKLKDGTVKGFRIGDVCKKLYAKANGLDANRLINDRPFKELHRKGLTEFHDKAVQED